MIERQTIATFADHRGALYKIWPGAVTGEVYAVELRPGHPRGHHVHAKGGEWFVSLQGTAWLVVEAPETRKRHVVHLDKDRVYVPAGIAHALFCDAPALVLAIAEVHYNQESTTPYVLAPPTAAERQAAR